MLFKHIITGSLICLVTVGCSEQPTDSTTSNNSGSPNTGTPDSSGKPTNPTTPPVTPPTVPTGRPTLTISGPIATSYADDQFKFQVCAGKVCDHWQQSSTDKNYEYTFEMAQWPVDKAITISAQRLLKTTGEPADSESYYITKLDNLSHLAKMDSADDGAIDENEYPPLSIDPINSAFNTIAEHLLKEKLKQHKNLPFTERNEAIKSYLSEQSASTWLNLSTEQISQIDKHLRTVPDNGRWRGKFIGEYPLELTSAQWERLGGSSNTSVDQQRVNLTTGQLKVIHIRNNSREETNRRFRLTTEQMAKIRGELVYSQQLVLELAALYQLLTPTPEVKMELGYFNEVTLFKHLAISNPGDGEPEIFDTPYEMTLDRKLKPIFEMYDAVSTTSGGGVPVTWTFNEKTLERIVKRKIAAQKLVDDNKKVPIYLQIPSVQWPTFNHSLNHIGTKVLEKLVGTPEMAVWKHYKQQFVIENAASIPTYSELNLSAARQEQYRYLTKLAALSTADFHHPLKKPILSIAPEKYLRINGRFPAELKKATVSVVLGSRPNTKPGGHQSERQPDRHYPIPVITTDGKRRSRIDYAEKNGFVVTIPLRNIDNKFEHCKPGSPIESAQYEYTEDEMQDTITVHVSDEENGVELRSILGSFCELVRLDQNANNNGTLEISELERLNVGYVSTALSAALIKTSITKSGYMGYMKPWTQKELNDRYSTFPREHIELLASIMALQAQGHIFHHKFNLIERAGSYADLVQLLGLDLLSDGYIKASNNTLPSLEKLQANLAGTFTLGEILRKNLDINVSHITQKAVQLLANSETDQYYFGKKHRPGSWVSVYPVSSVDPTCQPFIANNQTVGISIAGKGKDDTGHWVTIGWDVIENASQYTVAWSDEEFSRMSDAKHSADTSETMLTLPKLALKSLYYIRVTSNNGSPSALLKYSPRGFHISDSRATKGITGDDSMHGRDSNTSCDLLSGKAINSNKDGILGARYVKLDEDGKALERQDLTFKQQGFSCALDAETGLVWETKKHRGSKDPYTIHDSDNMFVMSAAEADGEMNATCALPGLNVVSTDPAQCTVANQIKWINEAKVCGLSNWRIPTLHETYSVLTFDQTNRVNMDKRYFTTHSFPRVDGGNMHGFWLDAPSLDGNKNRILSPSRLESDYRPHSQPNLLMLVSDGFQTRTEQ